MARVPAANPPRYFIDPMEGVCAVLLTQRFPNADVDLRKKFPQLVMQAVI